MLNIQQLLGMGEKERETARQREQTTLLIARNPNEEIFFTSSDNNVFGQRFLYKEY